MLSFNGEIFLDQENTKDIFKADKIVKQNP